ncbi:MAG: isoleucine--tRNA ligase [Armatimonadetes bacterium]|nr:isoleucine--tRNA ligase [Armatimonadota bacterium]
MDYKPTLNITLNDRDPGAMPQRGNLPAREPEIQRMWDEIGLYRLSLDKPAPNGAFILHDGPPYSNGDIHLGHALNKIAKDIIVKYKTLTGYRAPYVPGWDNHGMPIENNVAREFREKGVKADRVALRRRCREYAAGWVERQKGQFQRLGVRGDWDNPYLTMSTDFEAKIIEVFGTLAQKGFIYRGMKPVLWCATCETALADAEVEYGDHTSNSIYVRFPVRLDPSRVFGGEAEKPAGAYVLIWTTTPWTIPANLALAVHEDAEYAVIGVNGDRYLVAEPLAAKVLSDIAVGGREAGAIPASEDRPSDASDGADASDSLSEETVLARVRGSELAGLVCRHPLFERDSPVVFAPHVTMEDGTGVVHTAPGHGKEDFDTGRAYGLEVLCPVDASGAFTQQAGERFVGARILGGEADRQVMDALCEAGHLLSRRSYSHSYPHCWRCHHPLLFRATVQWFMDIDHDGHRESALGAIEATRWVPSVSINRIRSMVGGRPDWCLSRQRAWGVGIPAFYCRACGKETLDKSAIDAVHDLVQREHADAWYTRSASEILPAGFSCAECGGTDFDKETDILDVWFDSGSTHFAVLESERWPELSWPADVYLEGSDQHRGWFNSSLMVAVGSRGQAPYRTVITNGWTLDDSGKAMHKSLGNVVSPLKIVEQYGADILRLWVASTDYFDDVRCSDELIKQVAEAYRRIRNTFRFLVNNLADTTRGHRRFDPATDAVRVEDMVGLDRWALAQLDRVVDACRAGYEAFEFHRVYHAVHNFCAVELSAFYLDVLKDRLYCERAGSHARLSAQTALHAIARTLACIVSPILSHTADEVWRLTKGPADPASAQLAEWPSACVPNAEAVLAEWEPVLAVREAVNQAIEAARQSKLIGNPLEAAVLIETHEAQAAALNRIMADLPAVLKVSHVELLGTREVAEPRISVTQAPGAKCARCWLVRRDVGGDAQHPDLCGRCSTVVTRTSGPLPEASITPAA